MICNSFCHLLISFNSCKNLLTNNDIWGEYAQQDSAVHGAPYIVDAVDILQLRENAAEILPSEEFVGSKS